VKKQLNHEKGLLESLNTYVKKQLNPKKNSLQPLTCKICGKDFQPKQKNKTDVCCYDRKCVIKFNSKACTKRIIGYCKDSYSKIRMILCCRILGSLRYANSKKKARSEELLGCTIDEFREYMKGLFTEGMSWNNHGKWHIDHIRPLSSFDLTQKAEQLKAFHYTNCQPLWAKDNISKSNRIDHLSD